MSAAACRTAWTSPGGHQAARTLDAAFPGGACEIYSLSAPERTSVPDDELVARVLTSPGDYDISAGELVSGKLTSIYASGLSLIRSGATDEEILGTIAALMSAAGVQELYGAFVVHASVVRSAGTGTPKQFCVYDTDAPNTESHADIVGTFDPALAASAWKKEQSRRRYDLRDRLLPHIIQANSPTDLLAALRQAGI